MKGITTTGVSYGSPYVVATDAQEAYDIVKEYVDRRDLGFRHERELEHIDLLADEGDYPDCRTQLFMRKL
jgi:hypothetical protein